MFGVQPCTEIHFSLHGKKFFFRRRLTNDNQEDEVVLPNETFVGDDQRFDHRNQTLHKSDLFPIFRLDKNDLSIFFIHKGDSVAFQVSTFYL